MSDSTTNNVNGDQNQISSDNSRKNSDPTNLAFTCSPEVTVQMLATVLGTPDDDESDQWIEETNSDAQEEINDGVNNDSPSSDDTDEPDVVLQRNVDECDGEICSKKLDREKKSDKTNENMKSLFRLVAGLVKVVLAGHVLKNFDGTLDEKVRVSKYLDYLIDDSVETFINGDIMKTVFSIIKTQMKKTREDE